MHSDFTHKKYNSLHGILEKVLSSRNAVWMLGTPSYNVFEITVLVTRNFTFFLKMFTSLY